MTSVIVTMAAAADDEAPTGLKTPDGRQQQPVAATPTLRHRGPSTSHTPQHHDAQGATEAIDASTPGGASWGWFTR